ncbi:hypothetical protein RUND412_007239 [Rhizina undulata]
MSPSSNAAVQISVQVQSTTPGCLALSLPPPASPLKSVGEGVGSPYLLSGNLTLKLAKAVRVKGISVNFSSTSTYHNDRHGEILQYILYNCRLQIPLEPDGHTAVLTSTEEVASGEEIKTKKVLFPAGTYIYPFVLPLPAWLPPTVVLQHVSLLHIFTATVSLSHGIKLPYPLNHLLPFQHKHQITLQIPIYTLTPSPPTPLFWKGSSAEYKLLWRVRTPRSAYIGHPANIIFRLQASPGIQATGVDVIVVQQEQYFSCPPDIEKGPWGHVLRTGGKRKLAIGNFHTSSGECADCRGNHPVGGKHRGKFYSRPITNTLHAAFPPSPNSVDARERRGSEATRYSVFLNIPIKDPKGTLKPSVDSPLVRVSHQLKFCVNLDRAEDNKISIAIPLNVLVAPVENGARILSHHGGELSDIEDGDEIFLSGNERDAFEYSGESIPTRDGQFRGLPSYNDALWEAGEEERLVSFGARRRRRSVDTLPRYEEKAEA